MNNKTPKYVYVENRIKEDIECGAIVDRLPGERTIAKELGISYMTVRKAIENLVRDEILLKIPTKGTFVNDRKKEKKVTNNIGFFLDKTIKNGITSPYYSEIFQSLENSILINNYNLMFFSDIDDLYSSKALKKVDGLIIAFFPRLESKIHRLKKIVPIVLIDNSSSDKLIPSVTIDNFNGVVDAIDYLYSLGHERIGFISGLGDSDVGMHRLSGYSSALEGHGICEDKQLIYEGDYSYRSGAMGACSLLSLDNPPTAIMCANDYMALGAMKEIRERGLSVPEDVSVIGFDDIEVASQVHPPLTTIAARMKEIAETSVEMLISLIEGQDPDNKHRVLPAPLIIRDSCAVPKLLREEACHDN